MNPMQMLQGMKNPQQLLQQIVGNNNVMSNPMARNAMQMADLPLKAVEHAEDMKSHHIIMCR